VPLPAGTGGLAKIFGKKLAPNFWLMQVSQPVHTMTNLNANYCISTDDHQHHHQHICAEDKTPFRKTPGWLTLSDQVKYRVNQKRNLGGGAPEAPTLTAGTGQQTPHVVWA